MALSNRASLLGRSLMAGVPRTFVRGFSSRGWNEAPNSHKVAVVGAAGGIGQPLSMLFKLNPRVQKLSLYDLAPVTAGVGVDLSHINSRAQVKGFTGGSDALEAALEGCNLVVVPAGVPRKPGMTRQDLFNTNAGIVRDIALAFGKVCPEAHLLIISNPVNSTVPVAAETLDNLEGVAFNPRRLYGVTMLDIVRANTFVAEYLNLPVEEVNIPVLGGHAGKTIVPLLSHAPREIPEEDAAKLRHRIQFGGDEVVQAKAGGGSATLSMAYAGHLFADRLMAALDGEENVIECAYVANPTSTVPYFASPLLLGRSGIKEILPLPKVDAIEAEMIFEATHELASSISAGENFANGVKEPQNENEARAQMGLPPKEEQPAGATAAAPEDSSDAARAERKAQRQAKRAERASNQD